MLLKLKIITAIKHHPLCFLLYSLLQIISKSQFFLMLRELFLLFFTIQSFCSYSLLNLIYQGEIRLKSAHLFGTKQGHCLNFYRYFYTLWTLKNFYFRARSALHIQCSTMNFARIFLAPPVFCLTEHVHTKHPRSRNSWIHKTKPFKNLIRTFQKYVLLKNTI